MYKVDFHYEYHYYSNGELVFTEESINDKLSQKELAFQAELLTTNGYGYIHRIEVSERIEIKEDEQ